jgi:hypothetical protein
MRAPPAFEVTVHDAPGWRVVQTVLWALAGFGLGAWLGAVLDGQFDHGLAGLLGGESVNGPALATAARAAGSLALAALAGAFGWRLARPVQVRLRWSGQGWEVQAPGGWQPAALQVMLDLGGWMLLRVRRPAAGRPRWIGVSDAATGPSGHLLRAALYCAPCVDPGRADEDRARS